MKINHLYPSVKFKLFGKFRELKYVEYLTENDFIGYYRGFRIYISEQETGGFQVNVNHEDTGYLINGYYGACDGCSSLTETIVFCVKRIISTFQYSKQFIVKDIPFSEAERFCKEFQKDQCIILSWDSTSLQTWVTTFGVGDINSIQACNAGTMLKDFLELQRENDEIPAQFKEWQIESVDKFYYLNGRNSKAYVEITFWFEKHTRERKEERRVAHINDGNEYQLPDWAKRITERRRSLESTIW